MKFSIITPCYNAEKYIAEMIESVLIQSYSNFELIIVNDGSKDDSVKVIQSFSDDRIKLINQPNSGKPSIPRNVGIQASTGDLICFLDADDSYLPNKLEKIATLFDTFENADFIFHDHSKCTESLSPIISSFMHHTIDSKTFNCLFELLHDNYYSVNEELYKYSLFKTPLIHTNTITIKRTSYTLNEINFNEKVTCTEDLLLWNHLICSSSGIYLDEVLSTYRNSDGSVTDNKYQFDLDTYRYFKENLANPLTKFSKKEKMALKEKATNDILDAAYYQSEHNPKLAISLYWEALQFNSNLLTLRQTIKSLIKISYRAIFK